MFLVYNIITMYLGVRKVLGEAMPAVASELEHHGYQYALRTLFIYGLTPDEYNAGSVVDPDITRHSGLRALIHAHNFLLGETVKVDGAVEISADFGHTKPSACSSAEHYFLTLTGNINQDFDTGFSERHFDDFLRRATVATDASGEPVIIKKYYESESALTLKPISLKGFPIPAGTILGINLAGQEHGYTGFADDATESEQLVETLGGGLLRLIDVDDVDKVRPIRLVSFAGRRQIERFGLRKNYSSFRKAWDLSKFGIGQIDTAISDAIGTAKPSAPISAIR